MHKVYIGNECITLADDRELELFCEPYHQIVAAGGLVENPAGECLMIFRRGCWDLPKGKQEPGEDIETCALREVEEETGLHDLKLGGLICITHHTYHLFGEKILKHTYWYHMTDEREESLLPQLEEDITGAQWVEKERLPEYLEGTYPSIVEVFVNAGLL